MVKIKTKWIIKVGGRGRVRIEEPHMMIFHPSFSEEKLFCSVEREKLFITSEIVLCLKVF